MDAPERFLPGGPWPGVTLVQVTAVAALGVLGWCVARRGGPALRGAVVLAALVGLLAVPALATVAPVWLPVPGLASTVETVEAPRPPDLSRLPPPSAVEQRVALPVPAADPTAKLPPGMDEMIDPFEEPDFFAEVTEPAAAPALPAEEPAAAPPAENPRRAAPSAASIFVLVWLLGVVVCVARSLFGLGLLYHRAWKAEPVPDDEWADRLPAGAGRGRVSVRECAGIASPLTLGLFRSVILLPRGWQEWSAAQLGLVLAHELAHVRRRDFLAGLVAEATVCLCWFRPLVRWLAGRLRLEQEYAADAWAVSAGDATTYVRCLARLALEQGSGRRSPAPAFWRRRPEILRRIDMLRRNRDGQSFRLGRRTAAAVATLAAAACVAVAGVGPLLPPADSPAAPAAAPEAAPAARAAATADPQGDPLPDGAVARLGTTRWRQSSNITYMAYGADGNTLVTAAQDGTVRLWDMATGQEIRRFAAPALPVQPNRLRTIRPPAPATPQPPVRVIPAGGAATAPVAVPVAPKPATEPTKPGADAKPNAADDAKAKAEAALKARLEALKAAEAAAVAARAPAAPNTGTVIVAVSPDGKTVAVGRGATVQLYEVETGNATAKIEGAAQLIGLLFSPDGKTLAGRIADGGAVTWNAASGLVRHRFAPPPRDNTVRSTVAFRGGGDSPGMTFTPDGKALVFVTMEVKEQMPAGMVKFWDVTTGDQVRELKGPLGIISGIAFSPNGKVLAYCETGVVRAVDAHTGDARFDNRLAEPAGSVYFTPDGKRLVVRTRTGTIRVCDGASGREQFVLGEPMQPGLRGAGIVVAGGQPLSPEVRTVAFSPDGQRIATATGGTIRVWSAATGKEIPLGDGHGAALAAVVLSADGKSAVSWGADETVRRWDTATGKTVASFRMPAIAAAISPDGRTAVASSPDGTIRVFDTATGREVKQFKGYPRAASALAFSPDSKTIAERGADSVIRLYDPATGTEVRQLTAQSSTTPPAATGTVIAVTGRPQSASRAALVFSPDGKLLAAPGPSAGASNAVRPRPIGSPGSPATIALFDVATGKMLRKIDLPQVVLSYTFSPDGRTLAAENADDSVSLYEVASGKERARLGGRPAPAPVPAPAPGPVQFVAVGGSGFGVTDPAGPVTVAYSSDGRVLVSRGADRSARVWDAETGKELGQFKGHDGRVETVAVSTDGKTIATGSADTTVLLWDATTVTKGVTPPTAAELADGAAEAVWTDLAGDDAAKAAQGVRRLAAAPKQAAALLAERLKPTAPVESETLARLVADLESERFAVRQEATAGLVKVGEQAIPALQKVLASQPTIETRLRVEALLDKLTGGTLTAEQLRVVRSVEALERMGTPEARAVLQTLAGGAAGALPTREAAAALERLGGR